MLTYNNAVTTFLVPVHASSAQPSVHCTCVRQMLLNMNSVFKCSFPLLLLSPIHSAQCRKQCTSHVFCPLQSPGCPDMVALMLCLMGDFPLAWLKNHQFRMQAYLFKEKCKILSLWWEFFAFLFDPFSCVEGKQRK